MENFEDSGIYDSQDEAEKIKINFDILNEFANLEVFEAKLGNLAFLKRKRFSENLNEKEEKIKITLEKGGTEEKPIPPLNFIRWRYYKNSNSKLIKDDEEPQTNINKNDKKFDEYLNLFEKSSSNHSNKMQTNAKIIEWSDGTIQLVIGKEFFDVNLSNMDNCRYAILDKMNDMFVVKNPVKKRFIIVPSEITTNIDSRFKDSNENSMKTKLTYSYFDKNEYNKEDFAKGRFKKSNIDSLKRINRSENKILPKSVKRK